MDSVHFSAIAVSALLLSAFLFVTPVSAHHVHHEVDRAEAVVVTLAYGGGSPLAGDRYEIREAGGDAAWQTGRTDAAGRIVFLPDRDAEWRVRVFAEDGHGADFTLRAGPPAAEQPPDGAEAAADPAEAVAEPAEIPERVDTVTPEVVEAEKQKLVERFAGPVFGVGVILSLFGIFALFVRRRT